MILKFYKKDYLVHTPIREIPNGNLKLLSIKKFSNFKIQDKMLFKDSE